MLCKIMMRVKTFLIFHFLPEHNKNKLIEDKNVSDVSSILTLKKILKFWRSVTNKYSFPYKTEMN